MLILFFNVLPIVGMDENVKKKECDNKVLIQEAFQSLTKICTGYSSYINGLVQYHLSRDDMQRCNNAKTIIYTIENDFNKIKDRSTNEFYLYTNISWIFDGLCDVALIIKRIEKKYSIENDMHKMVLPYLGDAALIYAQVAQKTCSYTEEDMRIKKTKYLHDINESLKNGLYTVYISACTAGLRMVKILKASKHEQNKYEKANDECDVKNALKEIKNFLRKDKSNPVLHANALPRLILCFRTLCSIGIDAQNKLDVYGFDEKEYNNMRNTLGRIAMWNNVLLECVYNSQ